jgi:hypothetical protein
VFDLHFGHGEVRHVGRGEGCADANRGGSNQAVRLMERHAAPSELTAPRPRSDALGQTKWSESQAIEEATHCRFLRGTQTAPDLFHR